MPRIEDIRLVLDSCLSILESEEKWCQGHDAVNKNRKVITGFSQTTGDTLKTPVVIDEPVEARNPFATSWCAQGAVIRSLSEMPQLFTEIGLFHEVMQYVSKFIPEEWVDEMRELNPEIDPSGYRNIVRFNDHSTTTFEDVRLCFKKALHSLEVD